MTAQSSPGTEGLLPCPFCGGHDIAAVDNCDFVACKDCCATIEDGEPNSRAAWNMRAGVAQLPPPPEGATHMRRPEYLAAWRYGRGALIPEWLVNKYQGNPLPDHRLGLYALAIDGEFWRWERPEKFHELYCPVSSTDKAPCAHAAIISLDGKWHCQKCGDAIEVAVAQSSTEQSPESCGGGESRPAPIGPQASASRRSKDLIGEAGVAPSPQDLCLDSSKLRGGE